MSSEIFAPTSLRLFHLLRICALVLSAITVSACCWCPDEFAEEEILLLRAIAGEDAAIAPPAPIQEKFIFVTAALTNLVGTLPNEWDTSICDPDANNPAPSSSFKALVVGNGLRVACTNPDCTGGTLGRLDWVLAPSTTYKRADNTPVFTTDSNGVFIFGTATNPPSATPIEYWTGMAADWTVDGAANCFDWTNGTSTARIGRGQFDDSRIINSVTVGCGPAVQRALLCVEQ